MLARSSGVRDISTGSGSVTAAASHRKLLSAATASDGEFDGMKAITSEPTRSRSPADPPSPPPTEGDRDRLGRGGSDEPWPVPPHPSRPATPPPPPTITGEGKAIAFVGTGGDGVTLTDGEISGESRPLGTR